MAEAVLLHLRADYSAVMFQCCRAASVTEIPLGGGPAWQLVCPDPLTISPSVTVQPCGCRGRITNGEWEPM